MSYTKKYLALFAVLLGFTLSIPSVSHAQVARSVTGANRHLWVGAEFSDINPDYSFYNLYGVGIYADMNVWNRVSAEGQVRFLNLNQPQGMDEKSYMIGPSVRLWRRDRITINGKGLLGATTITYPSNIGYGSYFSYALGGNGEYLLTPRIKLRAEYEYDLLPAAPGFPGIPSSGLNPRGFSIGASYKVF